MKKQFELIRNLFILVTVLAVLQGVLLYLEPDIKHVVFACIVGVGWVLLAVCFGIMLKEKGKILYEHADEHLQIRLIEYDDFQHVRNLACDRPLTNSQEEVKLLQEYEAVTTDYVRIRYHYIAFFDGSPCAVIFDDTKNDSGEVRVMYAPEALQPRIRDTLSEAAKKRKKTIRVLFLKEEPIGKPSSPEMK